MARRSEHSKEELKILAIDAAIELIEENGFSNFSARAVAAKIGIRLVRFITCLVLSTTSFCISMPLRLICGMPPWKRD